MGLQRVACAGTLMAAAAQLAVGQPCSPYWIKPDPFDVNNYGGPTAVFDDGSGPALYAAAYYPLSPTGPRAAFSRWDGRQWTILNQGLPALVGVDLLRVLDDGNGPRLYGGGIREAPGQIVMDVTVWDGARWQPTPPGFGHVSLSGIPSVPMCSFDDGTGMAIYGMYGGMNGPAVSRWDGQRWLELGIVEDFNHLAGMAGYDLGDGPAMYVLGQFRSIGGVPSTRRIAKWKDGAWHSMGNLSGTSGGQTEAMLAFDDGGGTALYVCGDITLAGGVPITSWIAKWNGQRWADLPSGPAGYVRGLAAFDDGTGLALHATGDFASAGGVPARLIAKFDGTRWWPLGVGTAYVTSSMTVFDDGRGPSLFVQSGGGAVGGGYSSVGLVQWVGCPSCQADCNNDGRLNVIDFICFMNRYTVRDPYTNCNVDATIDITDFLCFQGRFAQGCP